MYRPLLKPKVHQKEAIKSLLERSLANFDDQGLGKTKQAYDTGAELIATNKIDLMMFIVRASLRENLFREISADGIQLTPTIVSGGKRERFSTYNNLVSHILILSYETAVSDREILRRLMDNNRVLLCLDESHYIKNSESQRSLACVDLSNAAARTLIFSGTPVPNKMVDLYPQLRVLGFDVGANLDEFRERFPTPEKLREFLSPRFIRRKKEQLKELQIPKKEVSRIEVRLSGRQLRIYEKARDELIIEIKAQGQKKTLHLSNLLVKFLRLIQVASNPRLVDPTYADEPAKYRALDRLVETEVGQLKRKTIIWTGFRKNVDELAERYSKYGALKLYGGLSSRERKELVTTFQKSDEGKIIIGIPACGREGFTLTRASTAIYLDRGFNYLDWAQSQDRIHRISQTEDCMVYVLEANDSIDCHVDDILNRKRHLQDYLLGERDTYGDPNLITVREALSILRAK